MPEKFYDKFYKKHQKAEKTTKKTSEKSSHVKKDDKNHIKSGKQSEQKNSRQKNARSPLHSQYDEKKKRIEFISTPLFETNRIPEESKKILENFDEIVQGIHPLNSKQRQQLPDNIRSLSHQLTDERSERRLGYMNEKIQLISYVRYYTWWNLVRLSRLFSNMPAESFPETACTCLDIGSGPLTVITALWLARPELRKLKLTWYCLDISANSMSLGEDIYLSIAARTAPENAEPWKIIRVKGSFGTTIKEKCSFITCANMLNEVDQANSMPPEFKTKQYYEKLTAYSSEDAKLLLVEPGVPKSARTLSLLRERFINAGKTIATPCPHAAECPMNGFKAFTGSSEKWCNFAFSTDEAPASLKKLSEAAKLPKERATLSFLSITGTGTKTEKSDTLKLRITSDIFSLPKNQKGCYACSKMGLTLIQSDGTKNDELKSGTLIELQNFSESDITKKDPKTNSPLIIL